MNSSISRKSNATVTLVLLVALVLGLTGKKALGQKSSIYNLYHQNRFIYNPANTGDKEYTDLLYSLNHQWVGVEGAPKVNVLGVHSPITKNMGFGGIVKTDRAGLEGSMSGMLCYSYKVNIGVESTVTFGLSAGLQRNQINRVDMKADNIVAVNQLAADNYDRVSFGSGLGVRYNFKGFEFGLAMPEMFLENYELQKHYVAIATYEFETMDKSLMIQPTVLYRTIPNIQQLDVSVLAEWKKSVWFSAGYRTNESSVIIASGVKYYNIDIGYGYQFGTGGVVGFSEGTYSILVAYHFKSNNSDVNAVE